jgi:hypothetical protein
LETEIKKVLKSRGKSDHAPLKSPDGCKTFVVAVTSSGGAVNHLRTYVHPTDGATECTIVEAARATSAAPNFFKPITIHSPSTGIRSTYVDSGVGYNNPSEQAIDEASSMWKGRPIGLLLSIGTGTAPPQNFKQSVFKFRTDVSAAKFISNIITEAGNIEDRVLKRSFIQNEVNYFRFNADNLGQIGLDEWKEDVLLNSETKRYMRGIVVSDRKEKCVQRLLQLIRSREIERI